ncbi:MAG: UDP-N-acetylmuramate dehydrogenase [Alphaproteobacteria bacterium]|nr:UDP-N-acetylmuramate dehydrogenase [Alphaproteobacteria bacterium]MDE2341467.1 UDP-N-acetylmuramate dehydrogenase [Alphaproteobacteria bacterium]
MSAALEMPKVRGKLTAQAPLASLVWFRTGGAAQWLFEPEDAQDLTDFLRGLPPETPVWALGNGSNMIIRDGGVPGVCVRLGKAFAQVARVDDTHLRSGAAVPDMALANAARDASLAGVEFLRGIPGTVGGAVKMNAGAHGGETRDCLVSATIVRRSGEICTLGTADLGFAYRHSELPADAIVVEALFCGVPAERDTIQERMKAITAHREAAQPIRSRTGGSTFKNPEGGKAWALIDAAGCRGLMIGGAQVSEKHCNFLINTGTATSADIETLGEEVRARVKAHSGVELHWEIKRVGMFGGAPTERVGVAK